MAACCGQLKDQPYKKKLGRCKTCMALSFTGAAVSLILLLSLVCFTKSPVFVLIFIGILTGSFTALSVLHIVFYYKKKV